MRPGRANIRGKGKQRPPRHPIHDTPRYAPGPSRGTRTTRRWPLRSINLDIGCLPFAVRALLGLRSIQYDVSPPQRSDPTNATPFSSGRFYSAYEERAGLGDNDVGRLYREYQPPITDAHHTCVGLGLTLIQQLASLHVPVPAAGAAAGPAAAAAAAEESLRDALHLVSCEEAIENPAVYLNEEPSPQTSEKEHVLVAARLDIGGRRGLLLLDPGYHVARVVTVMADGLYPHTGEEI